MKYSQDILNVYIKIDHIDARLNILNAKLRSNVNQHERANGCEHAKSRALNNEIRNILDKQDILNDKRHKLMIELRELGTTYVPKRSRDKQEQFQKQHKPRQVAVLKTPQQIVNTWEQKWPEASSFHLSCLVMVGETKQQWINRVDQMIEKSENLARNISCSGRLCSSEKREQFFSDHSLYPESPYILNLIKIRDQRLKGTILYEQIKESV